MAARNRAVGCYACGAVSGYHKHDADCPIARRAADEEEWRRVLEDIAEIDEKRTR